MRRQRHSILYIFRDIVSPATPANFYLDSVGDGEVTVGWDASPEPDLDHYNLYRSNTMGFTPGPGTLYTTINAGTEIYNDVGLGVGPLTNGLAYYYRLSAVDTSDNESGYADEVEAVPQVTQVVEPPGMGAPEWVHDGIPNGQQRRAKVTAKKSGGGLSAPTNLRGIPGDGQITWIWDEVVGAEEYIVYETTEATLDVTPGEDESDPSNEATATPGPVWIYYHNGAGLFKLRSPDGVTVLNVTGYTPTNSIGGFGVDLDADLLGVGLLTTSVHEVKLSTSKQILIDPNNFPNFCEVRPTANEHLFADDDTVYREAYGGGTRTSIFAHNESGGGIGGLVEDPDANGGNGYLFYGHGATTPAGLWRRDSDGTNSQQLYATGKVTFVALDPIGQRIIYYDITNGQIRIINYDGTGDALVVSATATGLAFDPDTDYVYYTEGGALKRILTDTTGGETLDASFDGTDIRIYYHATPTPPEPVTLLSETFTGTNGTAIESRLPDAGGLATKVSSGACTIQSNQGSCPAFCIYTWDVGETSYTLQITFTAQSSADVGALFRYVDGNNKFVARKDGSNLLLIRRVGGSWSTLDTQPTTPGLPFTLTIVVDGDDISITDDHDVTASATDSNHNTSTKLGFDDNAQTMTIDNVLVTTVPV